MPAQHLVTEIQAEYKGPPTKTPMALAKEWDGIKHYATIQIQVFPYPGVCFDLVPFLSGVRIPYNQKKLKKGQQACSNVESCLFFFFDQLNLGLLSLEGGNRIMAEVYKIMNCLKKLSMISDQCYSTVTTSSNTILGIYPCASSDLLTSVHYQHWQIMTTQASPSFDIYFTESSPFFLTLQQQFWGFTAVYHAARKQL